MMKQGSNSRRMRGRTNGKRPPRNNHYDSNGPEVRVRGSAQQVLEKYLTLARDAYVVDDRVSSENYYQHAEHYYRLLHADDKNDGQKGRHQRTPLDAPGNDQERLAEADEEENEAPSARRVAEGGNSEQAIIAELDGTKPTKELGEEGAVAKEGAMDPH